MIVLNGKVPLKALLDDNWMVGCDSILITMEDLPQIGFHDKLNLKKSTMKNVNFIKENTFLGYRRKSLKVVVQKLQEVHA